MKTDAVVKRTAENIVVLTNIHSLPSIRKLQPDDDDGVSAFFDHSGTLMTIIFHLCQSSAYLTHGVMPIHVPSAMPISQVLPNKSLEPFRAT